MDPGQQSSHTSGISYRIYFQRLLFLIYKLILHRFHLNDEFLPVLFRIFQSHLRSPDKLPLLLHLLHIRHHIFLWQLSTPHHAAQGYQTTDIFFRDNNLCLLPEFVLVLISLHGLPERLLFSSEPRYARHYAKTLTSKSVLIDLLRKREYKSGESAYNKGMRNTLLFYVFSMLR